MDYAGMVKEFIEKFDGPHDPKVWETLIEEEAKEVMQATADLFKELADLVYVVNGYAVSGGNMDDDGEVSPECAKALEILDALDELFPQAKREEAFARVHASNMSKLDPETGKPIKRADGKILKPLTYKPPVLTDLV